MLLAKSGNHYYLRKIFRKIEKITSTHKGKLVVDASSWCVIEKWKSLSDVLTTHRCIVCAYIGKCLFFFCFWLVSWEMSSSYNLSPSPKAHHTSIIKDFSSLSPTFIIIFHYSKYAQKSKCYELYLKPGIHMPFLVFHTN